jgi:hypothetical protein
MQLAEFDYVAEQLSPTSFCKHYVVWPEDQSSWFQVFNRVRANVSTMGFGFRKVGIIHWMILVLKSKSVLFLRKLVVRSPVVSATRNHSHWIPRIQLFLRFLVATKRNHTVHFVRQVRPDVRAEIATWRNNQPGWSLT